MDLLSTDQWKNGTVELFLLEPEHVGPAYVHWMADPEVNKHLESRFSVHDASAITAYVETMRNSASTLFLGMKSVELGVHVGNIKLAPIDRHHGLGEIGIMIGERAAWGKGIGSASIALLCDIARDQLGLRKLTAGCYAANKGSEKSFLKAGFHVEGIRPNHFVTDDGFDDLVLLARHIA